MKNPYEDLIGAPVDFFGIKCYVAFIEPDKGFTMKDMETGKEYCGYIAGIAGKPRDMSVAALTDPDRIWLDKTILDFAAQVRETGKYDAKFNEEEVSAGTICPSTI